MLAKLAEKVFGILLRHSKTLGRVVYQSEGIHCVKGDKPGWFKGFRNRARRY